jgi:hypothetical protein
MFKTVARILGVIAFTGWMGAANAALIFDFSWDDFPWDRGHRAITGTVHGLVDNDTSSATRIVFSSLGGSLVDIDVVNDPSWSSLLNRFEVADGLVQNFNVYAVIRDSSSPMFGQYVSMSGARVGQAMSGLFISAPGSRMIGSNSTKWPDPATVPEPSSVILMLLGLAGLSFARHRKQY